MGTGKEKKTLDKENIWHISWQILHDHKFSLQFPPRHYCTKCSLCQVFFFLFQCPPVETWLLARPILLKWPFQEWWPLLFVESLFLRISLLLLVIGLFYLYRMVFEATNRRIAMMLALPLPSIRLKAFRKLELEFLPRYWLHRFNPLSNGNDHCAAVLRISWPFFEFVTITRN